MEGRDQGVGRDCRTSWGRRALIGPNVYRACFVFSGASPMSFRFLFLWRPLNEYRRSWTRWVVGNQIGRP